MIETEKKITITIDGDDVKRLSNVCEIARIALRDNRIGILHITGVQKTEEIEIFLANIFEAVS